MNAERSSGELRRLTKGLTATREQLAEMISCKEFAFVRNA